MSAAKNSKTPNLPATPEQPQQQIEMLERILRAQLEGWRRTLIVIERQREALRSANAVVLEQTTRDQQQLTRTLSLLDQQRERLATAMQKRLMPDAGQALPITQLIQRCEADASACSKLLALAAELRTTIDTAKRRNSIVRDAADALARHIAGIQQVVHSALSRARVYGRRGNLALGAATPAAVDMKS